MPRGNVAYAGPGGETTILPTWNAFLEKPADPSRLGDAGDSWTSSMISISVSYTILAANNQGSDVPATEPISKADLRDVYLRATFQSTIECGDLQTVEYDLVRGSTLCLNAAIVSLVLVYPSTQAADMAGFFRPGLRVFTSVGRGTMRNALMPRRTLAAPVPNAGGGVGVSTPQKVPQWATTAFLENADPGIPQAQIQFRAGANGPIISSATIGKTPVSATDVPNGALYFELSGVESATNRVVFPLQL